MQKLAKKIALFLLLLAPFAAQAGTTELTWYGHAAFRIVTPRGHVLLIDPWITNPSNQNGKADLAALGKADLILLTYDHFDHVGDSVAIARKTGARLVATPGLGRAMAKHGYPAGQMGPDTLDRLGGQLTLLGGEVKIALIPALHSSTVTESKEAASVHDGGRPSGFLITIADGPTIYDTGDTDDFSDMVLVRKFHRPVDVMLAAIGGRYTMGSERTAEAVKLVDPKVVIPMHYSNEAILDGTPLALQRALAYKNSPARVKVLKIDQPASF